MFRRGSTDPIAGNSLLNEIRSLSHPLRESADLEPLMSRIGEARVVLLGEASHGTHEFYAWRTAITRWLIEKKGFNFVAVEGDWPDCYRVNRFVKGYPGSADTPELALETFRRWPTWMWANRDVQELIRWMEWFNQGRLEDDKVGFYGLDVYSLWDSLRAVVRYVRELNDPVALDAVRQAVQCFEPYGEQAQDYARSTALIPDTCREEVIALLRAIRNRMPAADGDGRDAFFVAEQNALVVKNAETYYRTMMLSNALSWNVRDRHMAETLERLLAFTAPCARAVVWAHNTHIGDARYTDMVDEGEVNLGQLARERYGDKDTVLIGFGTYRGAVIAGQEWDAPWQEMRVPARPGWKLGGRAAPGQRR